MPWRGLAAAAERESTLTTGRRRPGHRSGSGALLAAAMVVGLGCAKEEPPPGAEPDQTPPRVRDFRPEPGSVQPGFDDGFRVRFDEPIQENRGLIRNMTASPAYRYTISFGFSGFTIRPEGEWRSAVYRFVLPPPITDVLGNRSSDTITVVFSTGPPVTDTRVAGRVRSRATGEPVRGGRAVFLAPPPDTVPYTAVAGDEGTFRLPAVPPGAYTAYGFEDLNGNLSLDRALEPHDSTRFALEGDADSVHLELLLIEPDTTPPVLLTARPLDSTSVALTFDDPIRAVGGVERAAVTVRRVESADTVPVVDVLLARDTADAAAADTTGPEPTGLEIPDRIPDVRELLARRLTPEVPTVDAEPRAPAEAAADTAVPAAGPEAASDTALALPDTVAVVRLGRPLHSGSRYRVAASGFENLQRLAGGGDTTFVYVPADSADDARPDGAVPPDSAAARRTW